jgi:predicted O-methyltransferase YrrM
MQIGPEQGQFMALLVRLIGAKRCIELGTYTGYSALAVALALPPDGVLVACDVSDEFTRVGRPFWAEAGVESKIDLRLAPGLQTLDQLLAQPGGRDGYDFAFVDADKGNYIAYYEKLLQLIRPGGLIAVDNTLGLSGQYVTELSTPGAQAIRAFNAHVHHDARVELSMLPIGEGLTLLRVL